MLGDFRLITVLWESNVVKFRYASIAQRALASSHAMRTALASAIGPGHNYHVAADEEFAAGQGIVHRSDELWYPPMLHWHR
ncbi:hypothetical protein J7T55_009690 [Diaporthe amygdali]|uniref:uncharacterized protein n=1 Tax=Phomopsis amygdali TaxID=1214568 RepID=UPI0022FDBA32|nr:uncharacterized protein J7T55_009690 [Diaporthe amygdali]KAJ0104025.1 hypothetical protein J7T55_009690 [Diaporthe amygdali]